MTTARLMARRAVDQAIRQSGVAVVCPSRTHAVPIGASEHHVAEAISTWTDEHPELQCAIQELFYRYGPDAHEICRNAIGKRSSNPTQSEANILLYEVEYACQTEMVCSVQDLVDRRLESRGWSAKQRMAIARAVARPLTQGIGLTDEEFESQYNQYKTNLRMYYSL